MKYKELSEKIIGGAYRVYNKMGYGFLESVYEKCLLIELRKAGLKAESQKPITVHYDDEVVGEFVADITVEDVIILELKSVRRIVTAHEVQLVNYLTATKKDVGLIIPVVISIYQNRSFSFITKTPPAAVLLKRAAGIAKASGEPNKTKIGKVTMDQVTEIAKTKMPDLNAQDVGAAVRMVLGTARSMGIEVSG